MLVTNSITNFLGGVSQQPPSMRFQNQCSTQLNAVPSPIEGLTKRPPTEHVKNLTASGANPVYTDVFVHPIDRSTNERYFVVVGHDSATSSAFIKVYDDAGVEKTVTAADVSYLNVPTPSSTLEAVTIGDVSFILNTSKTVALSTDVSPKSRDLTTAVPECIVWVTQANYSRTYIIKINTVTLTYTTGTTGNIGTDVVAAGLETAFNTAKASNLTHIGDFSVIRFASELFFEKSTTTAGRTQTLDISVSDDFGGDAIVLINGEVRSFDDLPPVAPHHMKVKVAGSPESLADDYWVQFVQKGPTTSTSTLQSGLWFETVAPAITYKLDYSTMPHLLIRKSDGSFLFTSGNGATTPFEAYKWAERGCGDATTNESPSFIGAKIGGISLYQNRLLLLSGENAIFSETSEFFNFWRTTVVDSVSTDTIDVASTNPKVANLLSAVAFESQMIVFSANSQFSISSNGPLTPTSISMSVVGDYQNTGVTPIASGSSLFFPFTRGGYSGVWEMSLTNRVDGQFEAEDMSATIPQYIPGSIRQLIGSTHENYVLALSSVDKSSVFVYKYFQVADRRVQSAWSQFTLSSGEIQSISFFDSSLYLIVKRGAVTSLEKIRLESGRKDDGSNYVTTLDRRLDNTAITSLGGSISYSSSTGLTTYTLPYAIGAGSTPQVVTKTGVVLQTTAPTSTTLTVLGDYSAVQVWVGEKYTMVYGLSEPLFRSSDSGSVSAISGRYQVRYATISFGATAYFKAIVAVEYGSTYTYEFTGKLLGSGNNILTTQPPLETGKYRVPIYCNSTGLTFSIENDSPLPSNLIALEYEASYNQRTARV